MRIRRKKWAEDELKKSVIYIDKDTETKGKWKEIFKVNSDINEVNKEKENIYQVFHILKQILIYIM